MAVLSPAWAVNCHHHHSNLGSQPNARTVSSVASCSQRPHGGPATLICWEPLPRFLEHGSPERLIHFPKAAWLSGGRARARASSWVSLVTRIVWRPVPSLQRTEPSKGVTHCWTQTSPDLRILPLATPKIRANSIFRGRASNDRDAWAVSRSVDVARRRWCLIVH